MLIAHMYIWWFSSGWLHLVKSLFSRMGDTLSFFSIPTLLRTLFAPFRQISATSDNPNPISAFGDRLISRIIGAFVRLFLIIAGTIALVAELVIFIIFIICWPFVPFLPIAGIVLYLNGVIF